MNVLCTYVFDCVFPYYDMYTHIFIYIYIYDIHPVWDYKYNNITNNTNTSASFHCHFKPFQISSFQDSPQQFFIPIVQRMELGCPEVDVSQNEGALKIVLKLIHFLDLMFSNVAFKDILLCHTHPMVSIMLLTKNC